MTDNVGRFDVAIIGAGSIGVAVAYYLQRHHQVHSAAIIDPREPMSLTSAQSGENYRNWWPHPVMTAFTDDSIRLLEDIASETGNRIAMTRRGYALVTRRCHPEDLIEGLYRGYGGGVDSPVRIHDAGSPSSYSPTISADWQTASDGVDVLCGQRLVRATFPAYADDVETVIHIRRAGSISGQQLGQFMLEHIRGSGGRIVRGEVVEIENTAPFALTIRIGDGTVTLRADRIVNAAGPFVSDVARLHGEDLPVACVYQQKLAFEDREGAVPRNLPFTIDMDSQHLDWTEEEREILAADPATVGLTELMPGGIHCRPDGAEGGKWVKLGWAYNRLASDPRDPDPADPQFPDIVLRAASRLQAMLRTYLGRLPRAAHHYGGYYAMTEENWPLIGPMRTPGAFVAGAMSGFGTMAACISGSIAAGWVMDRQLPSYAGALGLARYDDPDLMAELATLPTRGVL